MLLWCAPTGEGTEGMEGIPANLQYFNSVGGKIGNIPAQMQDLAPFIEV